MNEITAALLKEFSLFSIPAPGIGSWISENTASDVFVRLAEIDEKPLTKVQLNQLLVLAHEAPISDGFYRYYWLTTPDRHPYNVGALPGFDGSWLRSSAIESLAHLKWGLYRLYTDALLYFGNIRTGFRGLRAMSFDELNSLFRAKRIDTDMIKSRGPALPLKSIAKDDRYLVAEVACKSYGDGSEGSGDLSKALLAAYREYTQSGGKNPSVRNLLEEKFVPNEYAERQREFLFSADDVLDEEVESEEELERKYDRIAKKFVEARQGALDNTRYYLSMVSDLDVYVATSMRSRRDFREMADACEAIFGDSRLRNLNLRFFDPTLSAASSHEDKGLIECLMVKCAKVLVYCAGERESYGKDAEAAMALSLGKPVIFYCDEESRGRFYREVHPLSRLIEFETGIAVGAMVTDNLEEVSELLFRIFENKMEYQLDQPKRGYLQLKEVLTDSVVRLQTSDTLLAETFWNHYHNQ